MRRSQRIAALTKRLVERPNQVFSLGKFTEEFGVAKSTLSDDLTLMRQTFEELGLGKIQTIAGAAGGVRYVPLVSKQQIYRRVNALCKKLEEPKRILPGGYIYLNDLVANPAGLADIAEIFASKFMDKHPSNVVTVETAGIPIALMTARALNVPLVVVTRRSRFTEGTVLTVNYVSGSSQRIETMSLSRRALPVGSNVLLIDDLMRAGGTLKGLADLMDEFDCNVIGKAVLIDTAQPSSKLISNYLSLIHLEEVDEVSGRLRVRPAYWITEE